MHKRRGHILWACHFNHESCGKKNPTHSPHESEQVIIFRNVVTSCRQWFKVFSSWVARLTNNNTIQINVRKKKSRDQILPLASNRYHIHVNCLFNHFILRVYNIIVYWMLTILFCIWQSIIDQINNDNITN